jgi:hypothetical protein
MILPYILSGILAAIAILAVIGVIIYDMEGPQ